MHKTDYHHLTDFDHPIYNIWKRQSKSTGANHFGNSESRWVDNLLYLCFTQEEIAEAVGCGKAAVSEICQKQYRDTESDKPAANHKPLAGFSY
jgi:hypothetical protein